MRFVGGPADGKDYALEGDPTYVKVLEATGHVSAFDSLDDVTFPYTTHFYKRTRVTGPEGFIMKHDGIEE